MADITPAAKLELPSTTTGTLRFRVAGEAISENDFLYVDSSDSTVKLALADTEEHATAQFIAQADCASGNAVPVMELADGLELIFGNNELVLSEAYAISAVTAGKLAPSSDIGTAKHLFMIGACYVATPASKLTLHPEYIGLTA